MHTSHNACHPILIWKHHCFTQLTVVEAHKNTLHGGMADTLAYIRKQYWIPQCGQEVKHHLKSYQTCKCYEGRPVKYPGPPLLPSDRVKSLWPFKVTRVDYTGAITVTGCYPINLYICLFTCAFTKAVHLELAEDLSAETFIQLFCWFAARQSCPRRMISNNAPNFVSISSFLLEIVYNPLVKQSLEARKYVRTFITSQAPLQNGFTERMIGIEKNCLKKDSTGRS